MRIKEQVTRLTLQEHDDDYNDDFFFENPAACDKMWKNIVETDRPQIIWRMRCACWIPKTINAHSQYVILTAFQLQ